ARAAVRMVLEKGPEAAARNQRQCVRADSQPGKDQQLSVSQDRSERVAADDGCAESRSSVEMHDGAGRYRLVSGELPMALRDRVVAGRETHHDPEGRSDLPGDSGSA